MENNAYIRESRIFVGGQWAQADANSVQSVLNPADETSIGTVQIAHEQDLARAVVSADRGFREWSQVSGFDRGKIMQKAADLMRDRAEQNAFAVTKEQGKPYKEALQEAVAAADIIDWFAGEARRIYGRQVPARMANVNQMVFKQPIGPVAAFSPWNFPINQATRKIAAALAAGCSIILKGPEETPAACVALVTAFLDAGIPPHAVSLVFGRPAETAEYLVSHPVVTKLSFTGSTQVGAKLWELSGRHLKRATMELGGHAPVLVFNDADIENAANVMVAAKFRNAGQICIAPTRFLVQERVYDEFLERFVKLTREITTGDGMDPRSTMGPLAHDRRITAIADLVDDALEKGAKLECGGSRLGNWGYFHAPTILSDVTTDMRAMNEEPFGPVALVRRFAEVDDAIAEANRLDVGLGSYVFTRSASLAHKAIARIEAGMVSINHQGLVYPELPFGGIGHSGDGKEGGIEALEPYLVTRFSTHFVG